MKSSPRAMFAGDISAQQDNYIQLKSARDERTPKLRPVVLKRQVPRLNQDDSNRSNIADEDGNFAHHVSFSQLFTERKHSMQNFPAPSSFIFSNIKGSPLAQHMYSPPEYGQRFQQQRKSTIDAIDHIGYKASQQNKSASKIQIMQSEQPNINQGSQCHEPQVNQLSSRRNSLFKLSKVLEQYNKQKELSKGQANKINLKIPHKEVSDLYRANQNSNIPVKHPTITNENTCQNTPQGEAMLKNISISRTEKKSANKEDIFKEAQDSFQVNSQTKTPNQGTNLKQLDDGQGFDFSFSQINHQSGEENSIIKNQSKKPVQAKSRKQKFIEKNNKINQLNAENSCGLKILIENKCQPIQEVSKTHRDINYLQSVLEANDKQIDLTELMTQNIKLPINLRTKSRMRNQVKDEHSSSYLQSFITPSKSLTYMNNNKPQFQSEQQHEQQTENIQMKKQKNLILTEVNKKLSQESLNILTSEFLADDLILRRQNLSSYPPGAVIKDLVSKFEGSEILNDQTSSQRQFSAGLDSIQNQVQQTNVVMNQFYNQTANFTNEISLHNPNRTFIEQQHISNLITDYPQISSQNDSRKFPDHNSTSCSSPAQISKKFSIINSIKKLPSQQTSNNVSFIQNTKPGRALQMKQKSDHFYKQDSDFGRNQTNLNLNSISQLTQRSQSDQQSFIKSMDQTTIAQKKIKKALSKISQESIFKMNIAQQLNSRTQTQNTNSMNHSQNIQMLNGNNAQEKQSETALQNKFTKIINQQQKMIPQNNQQHQQTFKIHMIGMMNRSKSALDYSQQ
eukprot:403332255